MQQAKREQGVGGVNGLFRNLVARRGDRTETRTRPQPGRKRLGISGILPRRVFSGLIPRALPHPADFRPGCTAGISLIRFEWNPLAASGKQRKGICRSIQNSDSMSDHVRQALQLKFPMSHGISLLAELADALEFISATEEKLITSFWKLQISMLRRTDESYQHSTEEWYSFTPPQLGNLSSKMHLVLVAHILQLLGCGGASWMQQYISGAPMVGRISYPDVFPEKEPKVTNPIQVADIRMGAADRFASRAKHRGPFADELRKEALGQVKAGWPDTHRQLNYAGNFADEPRYQMGAAFRFAFQSEKVRACGDLRHSHTNLGAVVASPSLSQRGASWLSYVYR